MNPNIEETIGRVEELYTTITGRQPPHVNGGSTRIPPEMDPARHIEEQLGKLMAAVENRFVPDASPPQWMPRAFAWQDDAGFELAIEVPGVVREQLDLRLDGVNLVVRGHRLPPWGDVELARSPDVQEAPVGTFVRSFVLPERVEPSQVTARLDSGVLRVHVVRRPLAGPLPIPIQG